MEMEMEIEMERVVQNSIEKGQEKRGLEMEMEIEMEGVVQNSIEKGQEKRGEQGQGKKSRGRAYAVNRKI